MQMCTRSTHTRVRPQSRSFVLPSSPFRHASGDRATTARRPAAPPRLRRLRRRLFFAVVFAAGLVFSRRRSSPREAFRGLPTARFAVEGFSAVVWIASRRGRRVTWVVAGDEAGSAFAVGVRLARGVTAGASAFSAFFVSRAPGGLRVDVCFGGDMTIRFTASGVFARGGDWIRLSARGVVAASCFFGSAFFFSAALVFAGVVLRLYAEGLAAASGASSSSSSAPGAAAKKPNALRPDMTCALSDLRRRAAGARRRPPRRETFLTFRERFAFPRRRRLRRPRRGRMATPRASSLPVAAAAPPIRARRRAR